MTASLAIAALTTTLTGLTHEDGVTTIQTIWPYPPTDPAAGNFPALAIEFSPDDDYTIEPETFQTPGKSNDVYPVHIFIFVGSPANARPDELQTRAMGWRVPLYTTLENNLNLSGNVAAIGAARLGAGNDFAIRGRLGPIVWNGVPLYGVVVKLWITEFI